MIMVSACLAGINCKYNGGNNYCSSLCAWLASQPHFLVCPETLGGLPIPRMPAEIQGGDGNDVLDSRARVVTSQGDDVTDAFIQGARAVLDLARLNRVNLAILKSNSPSCGCGRIYDGSFSRRLRPGDGVAAALLRRHGVKVLTEKDFRQPDCDT
ncbi:MAG: DUF523 domain-containing protein [Syntrophomonadaceae bacterium]|nr:DUF523 domain-containing protein [Syntrophomonadaceae bacterium]